MSETLTFTDLQQLTGYIRQADVERCLKDQGITFFWGKSGPWTTLHHLNFPGGKGYTAVAHEKRIIEF